MKKALPIICIVSLMIGCSVASTDPNISALYRVPSLYTQLPSLPAESSQATRQPFPAEVQALFQRIYAVDPALALEVGKIPEFQGVVGKKEILSLTRFTELIENASFKEKAKLAVLMETGKPSVRRYCAPLQALFWLFQEDECLLMNPLHYPLETILNYAWTFTDQDRWSDYQLVTDRLNSPELINFYEKRYFAYVRHGGCSGSAKGIFKTKRGCCSDYTAFSVYCLQKAGYEATAIKVVSPTPGNPYHIVCEYKDKDGVEYIMDVDCYHCTDGRGILEKKVYVKRFRQIGYGYR